MIISLVYLFYLISIFLLLRWRWKFVFFIPIFNLFSDMTFTVFEGFSSPTFLRAVILFAFLIMNYDVFRRIKIFRPFYIFFTYLLILLFFSKEFIYSSKGVFQVILSMSMFFAGYTFINTRARLFRLISTFYWIILFAVLATSLGYIFGIGQKLEYTISTVYESGPESVGLLGSGGLYMPAVILGIFPIMLIRKLSRFQLYTLLGLSFILVVFILLNVRRTAIIMPILGIFTYTIYSRKGLRILRYVLIFFIGIALTYPIYSDILMKRYIFREEHGRFESDFYKTETRFSEYDQMINSIREFQMPMQVIFGIGNNIFAEHVKNGITFKRMYHSDIPKLYFSTGLVGIFIYLILYLILFREVFRIKSKGYTRELKTFAIGLLVISVFIAINGSLTQFSVRSFIFLLLGAIIGIAHTNNLRYPSWEPSIYFTKAQAPILTA